MTAGPRHVVVTGGGTGAGAAIAHAFAGAGFNVTVMGRREQPLREQADAHDNVYAQVCDVTDPCSVKTAFAVARQAHGPVTIVIANAGEALSKPFSAMTVDDLDAMLAVNVAGAFNVFQAGLPDMKQAGFGRMIAIASTAGLKGYRYVAGYCAAKHGVIGLVRALAMELARTGVTANAICPGFVDTPMAQRAIDNIVEKTGMNEHDAAAALVAANPQERFVQTAEVAVAALYLADEAAASVNGHTLSLSGGEI